MPYCRNRETLLCSLARLEPACWDPCWSWDDGQRGCQRPAQQVTSPGAMPLSLLCLQPPLSRFCPRPGTRPHNELQNSIFLMELPVPAGVSPAFCRSIPKQLCLIERQVRTLPSRSLTSPSLRARCRQILSQGDAFRWLREVCRQANQTLPAPCVSACPP